jgi:Protein of unknown function (DUF2889)
MPLPSPSPRQPLHTRQVECRRFRRNDGLWDIEGHVVDTKPYDIPGKYVRAIKANQPVHDMWVRLTVTDDLGPIATTAYQTLAILRREEPERTPPNGPAGRVDSCFAYRRSGDLVRQRGRELFEKPDDPSLEGADT